MNVTEDDTVESSGDEGSANREAPADPSVRSTTREDEPTPRPPLSVRDVVGRASDSSIAGDSGDGPAERKAPSRKERGRRKKGKTGTKPTSVRQSLSPGDRTASEPEPRPFMAEAEEWVARLGGTSLTGRHSDPGAPLLHVTFHRVDQPDVPVRETLVVGHTFDVITDIELPELFSRSRPYKEPEARERPLRGGRGRGRRE